MSYKQIAFLSMIISMGNAHAMNEDANAHTAKPRIFAITDTVQKLHQAHTANNQKDCEKYAQQLASACLTEKSLLSLCENASEHWAVKESKYLTDGVKDLIHQRMLQRVVWMDKSKGTYQPKGPSPLNQVGSIYKSTVGRMEFSPDGKRIVAVSEYGKDVAIIDADTGRKLQGLTSENWNDFEEGRVNWATFSPDSQSIVIACEDSSVYVVDVSSGDTKHAFDYHNIPFEWVQFLPDGKTIRTLSPGPTIREFDITKGERTKKTMLEKLRENCVVDAISPDGKKAIVRKGQKGRYDVLRGGEMQLVDIESGGEIIHELGKEHCMAHGGTAVFSPNSDFVAVRYACSHLDGVQILDLRNEDIKCYWTVYTGMFNHIGRDSFSFSPDGTRLAINPHNGKVDIIDTVNGTLKDTVQIGKPSSVVLGNDKMAIADGLQLKIKQAVPADTLDKTLLSLLRFYCTNNEKEFSDVTQAWAAQVAVTYWDSFKKNA